MQNVDIPQDRLLETSGLNLPQFLNHGYLGRLQVELDVFGGEFDEGQGTPGIRAKGVLPEELKGVRIVLFAR